MLFHIVPHSLNLHSCSFKLVPALSTLYASRLRSGHSQRQLVAFVLLSCDAHASNDIRPLRLHIYWSQQRTSCWGRDTGQPTKAVPPTSRSRNSSLSTSVARTVLYSSKAKRKPMHPLFWCGEPEKPVRLMQKWVCRILRLTGDRQGRSSERTTC